MSSATLESNVSRIRIMSASQTVQAPTVTPIKTQCSSCHLRDLCLPCGMAVADVDRLDSMKFARRKIKAGQTLYREGDRFQFIYAVRAGTLKSSLMLADGREQVSGFHIAGELVGLEESPGQRDLAEVEDLLQRAPAAERAGLTECRLNCHGYPGAVQEGIPAR